jgi:hypothetical protein
MNRLSLTTMAGLSGFAASEGLRAFGQKARWCAIGGVSDLIPMGEQALYFGKGNGRARRR